MLGVDTVKNLVVPRFIALMLVTGLFNIYAILFGLFGGMLARGLQRPAARPVLGHAVRQRHEHGDLWGSVLKTTIFGGSSRSSAVTRG